MCGLVTMRLNFFKSLLARLTMKLFPPQFVVNAEAGLFFELRTVVLASVAFSTSQAWKMVEMPCVLLILIFKVFDFVVSSLEMILSLKSDYIVPSSPKTVIVWSKACLPLRLNFSPLITNLGEHIL